MKAGSSILAAKTVLRKRDDLVGKNLMRALLQRFLPDTPLPSVRDTLRTSLAIGAAVLLTGVVSAWLAPATLAPVLVASMGASAIILLALPTSPLAQPWPFVGGQLISFAIGIGLARWIPWPLLADAGLHHLPVVDAGGRLVGMITQSDLIAGLHWELARSAMERAEWRRAAGESDEKDESIDSAKGVF